MDPQAIFDNYRRVVTQHYFDMAGRVGRPEFWYFMLANFACYIVAAILQRITFLPLAGLYGLAMLLPVAGMGARRLQDTGKDGKLIWIFVFAGFIYWVLALMTMLSFFAVGLLSFLFFGPLMGLITLVFLLVFLAMIYFWCQPGDPNANAYGPPPPVFDASQRVSPAP